jgi:putative oxidoreductase
MTRTVLAERALSLGLLVLRVGLGGFLMNHGWGKVQMVRAGSFEMFGDPIGLGPTLSLILVAFAEFVCGFLVTVGLATRPAAAVIVFSMGVAAFVGHASDPWTADKGYELFTSGASKHWFSKQPALMFLIPYLALVFTGAGAFSVDAWIRKRWAARRTAAA